MRKSMLLGISGKTPRKIYKSLLFIYLFIHFGYSVLPRSGLELFTFGQSQKVSELKSWQNILYMTHTNLLATNSFYVTQTIVQLAAH